MNNRVLIISVLLLMLVAAGLAQTPSKVAILNFEPDSRAVRTQTNDMMHSRRGDFVTIFGDYEQYELLSQNEVERAMSSLGIATVAHLSSQLAANLGRELEADILIWGTVTDVPPTDIRVVANVMIVRSANINQLRFNLPKRRNDRRVGLKKELIEKISEFAGGELERLFVIGDQQLAAQNFQAAKRTFERIVEIEPDNIDAWFYLGYIAYMMADYDASVEYCEIGLDHAPGDERILNNLAEALIQVGRYECAVDALKKLAELENDENVWLRIAEVYFDLHDEFAAIGALEKALEINPESQRAHYRLGSVLFDMNEIEASIPHLQFIANVDPENDLINRKLTVAYMRTGKLDEAIESYRGQIERNPNNVTAYLNLAGALMTKEQYRESIEVLTRLTAFEKENATAYIRLSYAHIARDNLAAAERYANQARDLNPAAYEPYTLIAQISQARGYSKYEEFLALEEKAQGAFGAEADDLIRRRDQARNEANDLFQAADNMLAEALNHTNEPAVVRDVNARRQILSQLISETRRSIFD